VDDGKVEGIKIIFESNMPTDKLHPLYDFVASDMKQKIASFNKR